MARMSAGAGTSGLTAPHYLVDIENDVQHMIKSGISP